MSCEQSRDREGAVRSNWEAMLALYARGDLPQAESADLERHLGECLECRNAVTGYGRVMELLRDAHREPIPEGHYAAVRTRVLAELEQNKRPAWRWGWAWALAAVAIILAMVFPRPVRSPERRIQVAHTAPLAQVVETPKQPAPVVAVRKPSVHRRLSKAPKGRPAERQEAKPLLVKLLTDDPNVVIYWIADRRGE